jgi:hypothetical protein
VNSLVREVWDAHFADFQEGASGPKPMTRLRDQLKVLLLDLYVAWVADPTLWLGVSMSSNAWQVGSRYNALHISKAIVPFVHRLADVGLIDRLRGNYSGPGAASNRTTRIRAAEPLVAMFAAARFEVADVEMALERETVILRSDDGAGGAAKPLEYVDTEETIAMRDFLEVYNACLSDHFIDLPAFDRPFVERAVTNGVREGDIQRIPIGPTNAFVRRVFSRGSWEMNGRFYGGWWQQIEKRRRSRININDIPTVEVDFKGLHVAILCMEAGVPLLDDPYRLAEGLIPDTDAQEQRDLVKKLVLTAINAKSERAAFSAFRDGYPVRSKGKLLTNEVLKTVLQAFIAKYPHLDGCLCSDQGIRLMYVDSQIAERVLRSFTDRWIPCLCVHDSFIVDHRLTDELIGVMKQAATEVLGGPVRISQDFPGIDQFLSSPSKPTLQDYASLRGLPQRTAGYLHRLDQHLRKKNAQEARKRKIS